MTATAPGRVRVLTSSCEISQAWDPKTGQQPPPPFTKFNAIWDTGASGTCITPAVAQACGLQFHSMITSHTAAGSRPTKVYMVNLRLPHGVGFMNLNVTEVILNDADILIGMDIIGMGDFAVTQNNGKTVFSYRLPQEECIDFVKIHDAEVASIQAHNTALASKTAGKTPCHCGSGRQFRYCCGKKGIV